jgi:hypothetical protein
VVPDVNVAIPVSPLNFVLLFSKLQIEASRNAPGRLCVPIDMRAGTTYGEAVIVVGVGEPITFNSSPVYN